MGEIKWYKRDPLAALEGMSELSLEERGAYNTVLDLIYSRANNLEDDDRWIAGWLRCDIRVWRRIKRTLVERGKLYIEDGLIRNRKSDVEIDEALSRGLSVRELNQSKGRKSGEARRKKKDLAEPAVQPLTNTSTTTTRREEAKASSPPSDEEDEVVEAVNAYNATASLAKLPICQKITKQRRTGVKARIRDAGGLGGWFSALEKLADSPYCCGENDKGWKADLDFLLQEKSFTKLMEGSYARRRNGAAGQQSRRDSWEQTEAILNERNRRAAATDGAADGETNILLLSRLRQGTT